MMSRYEVLLNDIPLSSIDSMIYVSDIGYTPIALQYSTSRIAGLDGVRTTGKRLETNRIAVAFELRQYRTEKRQNALQAIIKWCASGGWLETSDRPGQHIYVKCSRFPAVASALRWLDSLTIEFTAFDYPYWTDKIANVVTVASGSSDTLYLPGAFPSFVEAVITPSGAITGFTLGCSGTSIQITDVSITTPITLTYTEEHHLLHIQTYGIPILDKRTAASDDDLIAMPGNNTVSFSAVGSASCEFSARGVYL